MSRSLIFRPYEIIFKRTTIKIMESMAVIMLDSVGIRSVKKGKTDAKGVSLIKKLGQSAVVR